MRFAFFSFLYFFCCSLFRSISLFNVCVYVSDLVLLNSFLVSVFDPCDHDRSGVLAWSQLLDLALALLIFVYHKLICFFYRSRVAV